MLCPQFTAIEFLPLQDLETEEISLCRRVPGRTPARFIQTLEKAVINSGRWKK